MPSEYEIRNTKHSKECWPSMKRLFSLHLNKQVSSNSTTLSRKANSGELKRNPSTPRWRLVSASRPVLVYEMKPSGKINYKSVKWSKSSLYASLELFTTFIASKQAQHIAGWAHSDRSVSLYIDSGGREQRRPVNDFNFPLDAFTSFSPFSITLPHWIRSPPIHLASSFKFLLFFKLSQSGRVCGARPPATHYYLSKSHCSSQCNLCPGYIVAYRQSEFKPVNGRQIQFNSAVIKPISGWVEIMCSAERSNWWLNYQKIEVEEQKKKRN